MSERLYYIDAYRTEFDAAVVARDDDGRRVYLDRTAFYPTSGGQPFDTGDLGGVEVVDVVDEGDRIAHVLAGPVAGERLHGRVDWTRRFDHMQQHTGQHVLSAVIAQRFHAETLSVHFGRDASTLDLAIAGFSHDDLVRAETSANEVVTEDRPVGVSFEEASAASGLRKASRREGMLRIVTIEDLDRSACGGTHVRATGQIGPILIGGVERVKQLVRLEFRCGARAVRRARRDADLLDSLAASHSARPEELPALLENRRAELKEANAARHELEEMLAGYRARELYASVTPDADGRRVAVLREAHGPVERLRSLALAFAGLPAGVLLASTAAPPAVILGAAADAGADAGRVLKAALQRAGGRGGGNARLAQGSVGDAKALDGVVQLVLAALTGGSLAT
jgi:alanyl-tRNA synthetase